MSASFLKSHIIIYGPGRCGTTFLWELLNELGFETGREKEFFRKYSDELDRGESIDHPLVLKGTAGLARNLHKYLVRSNIRVGHIFLCVRALEPMLKSHIKKKRGHGIYRKMSDKQLEKHLREELPATIGAGLINALPYSYTIAKFPDIAESSRYAYEVLKPVLSSDQEDLDYFNTAHSRAVKPELIRFC